jgi:hypothetical protein
MTEEHEESQRIRDKGYWRGKEWKLKNKREHYYVFHNKAGLVRIKCKHCEFVVIAEKRETLLALNLMHRHLHELHRVPQEDLDK